jgi:hypothetical protein
MADFTFWSKLAVSVPFRTFFGQYDTVRFATLLHETEATVLARWADCCDSFWFDISSRRVTQVRRNPFFSGFNRQS